MDSKNEEKNIVTEIQAWLFLFLIGFGLPPNPVKNASFELQNSDHTLQDWSPVYGGYHVGTQADGTHVLQLDQPANPTNMLGVIQRVTLNQQVWKPVRITIQAKVVGVADVSTDKYGASLYCVVTHTDASKDYCPTTAKTKLVGTTDWVELGFNTASFPNGMKPITTIDFEPLMGQVTGTAYFDQARIEEHEPHTTGVGTIMLDDGWQNQYDQAPVVLNSYGLKASFAIVTSYVGTQNYMTLTEVHDLFAEGHEIVNHSVTHRDMTTLSQADMEAEYTVSAKWFADNGFWGVLHFAIPLGAYNGNTVLTGLKYNLSLRTVDRGWNAPGTYRGNVWIQEVDSDTSLADVQLWIDTAKNDHRWLVLLFHEIKQPQVGNKYMTTPEMFSAIVSMLNQSGMPILPYRYAFEMFYN